MTTLSDKRILELRDEVLPSQGEQFDCIAFAHAIEHEMREQFARIVEQESFEAGSTYYRGVLRELAMRIRG